MSLTGLERTLGPLDELRLLAFKVALRSRALSSLLVRRDNRLAAFASAHALVAFTLAVYFPVLLFVLGPILFGVAHVAADVRYLVLRRKLARWWQGAVVAACVTLVGLHTLELLHWLRVSERLELGLVVIWAVMAALAGAQKSRAWTRLSVGLVLTLAVGALALYFPRGFRLLFLHAHNLVALAIWPLFYRARPKRALLVLLAILAGSMLLGSGALYRASLASPGVSQFGVHVLQVSMWVAPVVRVDRAIGLTSAFVFLQAVHYSIWLSVIPQGALPGQGTLTFRRSARSLLDDFGVAGVALITVGILAVVVGACFNAPRASASYMTLALFHSYLEVVLLLYFWVSATGLRPGANPRVGGEA